MSKPRAHKVARWDVRCADVLAGKTKLDAISLIALINEVNPTGRDRDSKETVERYALKARLESLLVKAHPQSLEVVRDPENDVIVSIRSRLQPQSACHAAIDTLDDEARSWVLREIDVAAWDSAHSSHAHLGSAPSKKRKQSVDVDDRGAPPPSDPDALLEAAEHAEAEYDYERAADLYRLAVGARADERSALAALRFLIDTMGADAEALAIEARLPANVATRLPIRAMFAFAAARSGDEAKALANLERNDDPRAAEAFAQLAKNALGRGDSAAGAQRVAQAQTLDRSNPSVIAVADQLSKVRAAERAPLEQELSTLMSDGNDEQAARKADAILARWPESEAARRAAKALTARREAQEGLRRLQLAEAALARGESVDALALFRDALRAPLAERDRQRADEAVRTLEAEQREKEASRNAERVAAALAEDGKQARVRGFAAFLELSASLRARVRTLAAQPVLEWLEMMDVRGVRTAAAVEAGVVLENVAAMIGADPGMWDPAAALALLNAHERSIDGVPAAERLLTTIRERLADVQRVQSLARLREAEQALVRGEVEEARRSLERIAAGIDRRDLSQFEALRTRVDSQLARHQLEAAFDDARRSHLYSEARRLAEQLAARPDNPERERWSKMMRELPADIRHERRVRVFDVDAGPECSWGATLRGYQPDGWNCIDVRRGLLILPTTAGRHTFIRMFSLETLRLVRCIYLLAPGNVDRPRTDVVGDNIQITCNDGLLEVAHDGDPQRWLNLHDATNMDREFQYVVEPIPQGRYLWVLGTSGLNAVDLHDQHGRMLRKCNEVMNVRLVLREGTPMVATIADDPGWSAGTMLTLNEPGGAAIARYSTEDNILDVDTHPAGDGSVVMVNDRPDSQAPEPQESAGLGVQTLEWKELSMDGKVLSTHPIRTADILAAVHVASARDLGMTFVRFNDEIAAATKLLALAMDPGTSPPCLRELYRAPISEGWDLVTDRENHKVYAVSETDEGIRVVPLGPAPPSLPARAIVYMRWPLSRITGCGPRNIPPTAEDGRPYDLFEEQLEGQPPEVARARSKALREEHETDRVALLDLAEAYSYTDDREGLLELANWLIERHPSDAEMQEVRWNALAGLRRWSALAEVLQAVDVPNLPEAQRQHWHHLVAAIRMIEGDLQAVESNVEQAARITGHCDLDDLVAMRVAASGEEPPEKAPAYIAALRLFAEVVQKADALLAEKLFEKVLELFERRLFWMEREAQSMARLASAHLALPADTSAARLRKSLALALFAGSVTPCKLSDRHEIIVPGATWSDERLSNLAAEAESWLASRDAEPCG